MVVNVYLMKDRPPVPERPSFGSDIFNFHDPNIKIHPRSRLQQYVDGFSPSRSASFIKPISSALFQIFGNSTAKQPRKLQRDSIQFLFVWRDLPTEIVEAILIHAIHLHGHKDPIFAWNLRDISTVCRLQVDQFFSIHWVPKLRIRVCFSENKHVIYKLDPESKVEFPSRRCLTLPLSLLWKQPTYLGVARQYATASKTDESQKDCSLLVKRSRGGYRIKSALVVNLRVSYCGNFARCDWRRTLDRVVQKAMKIRAGDGTEGGIRWGEERIEIDVNLFEGIPDSCWCFHPEWEGRLHQRKVDCL